VRERAIVGQAIQPADPLSSGSSRPEARLRAELPAPQRILIIGYGSELRGDDAAGPIAARALAERGFEALAVHQLTPELAEPIAAARTVIFLDAHADLPPGEVSVARLSPAAPSQPLEHHASPAGLLRLAREAYGTAPAAWLVGMGGENFELRDGLSAAGRRAVAAAIDSVQQVAAQS
jgi:hydrogenase maturation protease